MRERGLKLAAAAIRRNAGQSLPVRERGLKHLCFLSLQKERSSLPVRERGLKLIRARGVARFSVAPRAGAWIEASPERALALIAASLPVRERGLKRSRLKIMSTSRRSLPVRERGLKLRDGGAIYVSHSVAPRAGAWIEACSPTSCRARLPTSLPVRERGLKLVAGVRRGDVEKVAPRAGAWIEAATRRNAAQ